MPAEADIVWSLKQHLQMAGLGNNRWSVNDIAVDSDGSYRRSRRAEALEPMFSMPIRGFYPDLVCSYSHPQEEGLAAFEVKGRFDEWLKGITQARAYREGVHRSYLAVPEDRGARLSTLEREGRESGVGVWLLKKSGWDEILPAASPRPDACMTNVLKRALKGLSMPGKLKLNHPLNYLVVAWVSAKENGCRVMEGMEEAWADLRTECSRNLAIRGAQYLGLVDRGKKLTQLGLTAVDLMEGMNFSMDRNWNKRTRFCDDSPGLATIARLVLMQQEGTKLIIEALLSKDNLPLNTEELLRAAERINPPLASGLLLLDPKSAELTSIPSIAFSPSNVFVLKQVLWHSGILSTKKHPTAGGSSDEYRHEQDFWRLDDRIAQRGSIII